NISRLWTTYEYTDYTMRGKSELQKDLSQRKSGLDKEYAFRWSYGVTETFTFIIPDYYGRSSNTNLGTNCELYKQAESNPQLRQQLEQGFRMPLDEIVKNLPTYWGEQPFTSGGTYLGIAVVFLYILSFFVLKNKLKWYILGVTILTIMLAWGRNFFLSDIFFDYFPLYNKFRAVAMMLVVAEFTFPFMGFLALSEVLENLTTNKKGYAIELWGYVWKSAAILGGVFVFAYLLAQMGTFKSAQEMKDAGGLADLLVADRKAMLGKDVARGLMFLALTVGLFWAYLNEKINQTVFLIALAISASFDLWSIDKRFLNSDSFVPSSQYDARITQTTPADEAILKDKSHKRVLKFGDTFNDAHTSYFHKSVGGYHPAKFRRYQDLIETGIQTDMQTLGGVLQKGANDSTLKTAYASIGVLNMLNTKYVIYDPSKPPLTNSSALGNAWFVSEVKQVKNADEELAAMKGFNPAQTAIVADEFIKEVQGFVPAKDSASKITLLEYQPDNLKYEANNAKEGLAVFSEVYYGKGWNAYVDGKLTPHIRANYVLRAMKLPAGKHNVEFKFEPQSYHQGESYSLIGSLATLLLFGLGLFMHFKEKKETA
ncbi:MAG: YfhO family protein, partial [Bacteroidia bacterium]